MAARWLVVVSGLVLSCLALAAVARIKPGDRIRVSCPQEKALDGEYAVSADGVVQLPLLGIVEVVGKEPEEAGRLLSGLLEKERLATGAQVKVEIVGAPVRPKSALPAKSPPPKRQEPAVPVTPVFGKVRVVGAVAAEAEVDAIPGMTLDKALARAEMRPEADLGAVLVTRPDGTAVSYDCSEVAPPVPLGPGDVVEVPALKEPRSVTVLGAVASSGAVEFYPGLTIADAVERSGGVAPGAKVERVTLVRQGQRSAVGWPEEARATHLKAGDAVEVLALGASGSIALAGAVRRPGLYAAGQGTTLGMVMRIGGGTVPGADLRRVAVHREGSKKPQYVDYLEIEQGLRGDVLLSAGDRVVVEGPGKRRYGPGAAAGVVGLVWFVLGR